MKPKSNLSPLASTCACMGVSLLLVACGGGGDGGASTGGNTSPGTSTGSGASPASSTPSTAGTPPVGTSAATNSTFASCAQIKSPQDALNAVNAARAMGRTCGSTFFPAAPALQWNDQLASAALAHSKDMATRNFFDHTNPDGESPFDRTAKAGYGRFTGENIAAGYGTMDAVMQGWLSSSGHCANIMRASYKDFALACTVPASGAAAYNIYWTQNFGAK
jgi:uncharacterized protein YkwD